MATDFVTLTGARGTAGSIADFLNNSQIQNSVDMFIHDAEAMIYRRLRHFRMLSTPTAGVFTVGSDQLTPPSDFLDPYLLYLTANSTVTGYGPTVIPLATPEQVMSQYSYDGTGTRVNMTPRRYYFNSTYLQFDSPADLAYPYALVYYQQPAALSVSNTTNFLTQYYPRMLRAAILAEAVEWTKESGSGQFDRTYWLQVAQAEIDVAQAESDYARRSASNSTGMVGIL